MPSETLSQKDKELIAVACAVSAGCQRCCNFHFKKVLEVGASETEVQKAVEDAQVVIHHADELMLRHAYDLMKRTRAEARLTCEASDSISALVKLGAAVATNCTPTIEAHLLVAKDLGVSKDEINVTVKLAQMVLRKAAEFANEAINESLGKDLAC